MAMNLGRPVGNLYRVVHRVNGGDWEWLGPLHYTGDAAVRYMDSLPFTTGARKEDRKVVVMVSEAAGNAYLEQINRENQYHPTPQEVNHMMFIRWLILQGKLSEQLVDTTP